MNVSLYDEFNMIMNRVPNIESIKNKTFFIPGATGLIGKYLVDFLMYLNIKYNFNVTIIANSRRVTSLESMFSSYIGNANFHILELDINKPIVYSTPIDYVINCASNTHPRLYSTDPIGTIMTNIQGTSNVLDFAYEAGAQKILFLSSVEIYGENKYNVERFKESEMGFIDCNTLRAGYNEAKRAGESLCQAYIESKGLDISIVRLPRVFGPTVKRDDSKVITQFIKKALLGQDIVLKSEGNQYYSYLYIADAISGMLTVLLAGKTGEAYNLGNEECDIRLKDLAKLIANMVSTEVVFELPDDVERKGYSKAIVARLDYTKIEKELDWHPYYSIEYGIKRTLEALKQSEPR